MHRAIVKLMHVCSGKVLVAEENNKSKTYLHLIITLPLALASCHRLLSLSSPVSPVVLAIPSHSCLVLLGWEAAGGGWQEQTT